MPESVPDALCVWSTKGVEQQLTLLMAVVNHIHTAVESCTSDLVRAQQAQQLHEKLQLLRTAVLSAEAGAGRSVFFFPLCHCCDECACGLDLLSISALALMDVLLSPVNLSHGIEHALSFCILSMLYTEFTLTTSCCMTTAAIPTIPSSWDVGTDRSSPRCSDSNTPMMHRIPTPSRSPGSCNTILQLNT